MTETTLLTKLGNIYDVVANVIETVSTDASLSISHRQVKVISIDKTGKIDVANIKYVEWYLYLAGLAGEKIFLLKKDGIDAVDDVLNKTPA